MRNLLGWDEEETRARRRADRGGEQKDDEASPGFMLHLLRVHRLQSVYSPDAERETIDDRAIAFCARYINLINAKSLSREGTLLSLLLLRRESNYDDISRRAGYQELFSRELRIQEIKRMTKPLSLSRAPRRSF